jgi:predicted transcriptional regulator
MSEVPAARFTELTAQIVSAYVEKNRLAPSELPALISAVHAALSSVESPTPTAVEPLKKLTSAQIRRTIQPDSMTSLEDGKVYKTLKRHLGLLGLTPNAYREKWGLPNTYPMTAPSYSQMRSEMAKRIGLGVGGRKAAGRAMAARSKEGVAKPRLAKPTMKPQL